MKKIYNNKSKFFKDWTTKKLKEEAIGYDELIYKVECYGTRDIMALNGICAELKKRGIEVGSKMTFNKE